VNRAITLLLASAVLLILPDPASAQRFGGDFGGCGGFWLVYADLGIDADRSFGRDVGGVITLGGRGFLQTGKVRLGGGAFGGGFVDKGQNSAGNSVQGGFSAGGFTAEYLIVQQNLELVIGGMAGGGVLTIEEIVSVSGEVEDLRRRKESMFVGYPWVRVGYNPAPFINVGLQLGYMVGTQDVGGFAMGLDIMAGLIP
jgi:hypothetical protein